MVSVKTEFRTEDVFLSSNEGMNANDLMLICV